MADLVAAAESAKARLVGLPQLRDVRVGMQLGQPELEIEVDRDRASRYGLSVYDVASTIESYLRGLPTAEPFTEFSDPGPAAGGGETAATRRPGPTVGGCSVGRGGEGSPGLRPRRDSP